MSDLGERLERLGLSQYLEVFVSEGFDSWETVLDITESDLSHLNVKLGHRRKLQRAIAESRGQSADRPLPIALGNATASIDGSYRSDDSAAEGKGKQGDTTASGATGSTKRKYRRHPKADEHAPERPPSAYVIFSNQVRETLRGQELSFTEIAKVVGERWQVLPAEERETCERQANTAKERYYAELTEYKKTPQYESYQKYLEEFKAKHAAPTKGKRSKLETETSTSTRSNSHEQPGGGDRSAIRRISSAQSDPFTAGHNRSESSPPVGPARLPAGPQYPTPKSNSPATQSLPGLNSPHMADHYSPMSASPRSASLHKENSFETHLGSLPRDPRGQSDTSLPYHPTAYAHPHQPASTTPPSGPYGTPYQPPIDLPSRRPLREPSRLPPLTHEDTTLSSESGHSGYNNHTGNPPPSNHPSYPGSYLPIDPNKSMRVLPQPVPSLGATPSPLNRPPPPPPKATSPQQQQQYGTSSSLAALLRAGELARVADDEAMEKDGSP